MNWGGVNFLGVGLAAVAAMVLGAAWYGLLAQKWMADNGFTEETVRTRKGGGSYPVAIIAKLVMAYCLAKLLALVDAVSVSNGVALALFLWIGFVATVLSVNQRFALKPWRLTFIDAGYWLAVLIVMGIVIGWVG